MSSCVCGAEFPRPAGRAFHCGHCHRDFTDTESITRHWLDGDCVAEPGEPRSDDDYVCAGCDGPSSEATWKDRPDWPGHQQTLVCDNCESESWYVVRHVAPR
jgi:hypothetical protein